MPPAAIALISEPIITFQPTEASMAEMASRTSMVSIELASSPPQLRREREAEDAFVDEDVDRFVGQAAQLLRFVAAFADDLGERVHAIERGAFERRRGNCHGSLPAVS